MKKITKTTTTTTAAAAAISSSAAAPAAAAAAAAAASAMSASAFADARSTAKASDSAIDSYASKVLKRESPPDAVIDASVGPYVTSLLRCAEIKDAKDLSDLEEYESLLELLEDQCNMDATVATNALQVIAEAVVTQMLPLSEIATGNGRLSGGSLKLGLYTGGESSLDSFQSMREQLPGAAGSLPSMTIEPYTPTAAGGPSPLKPDNLIPGDLLGALDNPSPNQYRIITHPTGGRTPQYPSQGVRPQIFQFHTTPPLPPHSQRPQHPHAHVPQHHLMSSPQPTTASSPYLVNTHAPMPDTKSGVDFPPLDKANEFPPLGASTGKPKRSKSGSSKKTLINSSQKGSGGALSQQSALNDKELAAALFRPARPRQNSSESEQDAVPGSSSVTGQQNLPQHLQQRSRGSSIGSYHAASSTTYEQHQVDASNSSTDHASGAGSADMAQDYYLQQQQLSSCVEILLSMNQELSEEAATEAALMAHSDFNVAQYIVDAAMTAPPICRHMLQEGCYRSDCQFSHDVDGHSCLFWIRGRCGKGASCKFLHGFNEKMLDGIPFNTAEMSNTAHHHMHSGYNNEYPSYQTSTGDGSGATATWQTPSLADSSTSNSYSSGDTSFSFANVASKGYDKNKFSDASFPPTSYSTSNTSTVRIPQDLWNPHENRDAAVFHITDPLERYQQVASTVQRTDVIDLHFQSTKTFPVVLSTVLPSKLGELEEVWIVTGTGHHVGSKTHQRGGGALERAVVHWLIEEGYNFLQGKDRNGLGGALLVKR